MRFRLFFALVLLSLLLSACNLGSSSGNDEEQLPTADLNDSSAPLVTILSPANGSSAAVNDQILVSVIATHPSGVTRIQLFADGQPVKTISSESINGDPEFEGILDFTPRAEGEYTLRVLAFRNAISSVPVDITVNVGEEDVQVTERSTTGSTTGGTGSTGSSTGSTTGGNTGPIIPVIPNDGLCRVLVNVGLNLRAEPTTQRQNVITTLASGTLLLVVARLGDNSWWKVNYNNRIGWVSGNAQYTTLYGNCGSVPVENFVVNTPTPTRTPSLPTATFTPRASSTPGTPDLLVPTLLSTIPNIVIPSGATEVIVEFGITVKNQGSGPSGQFSITLREGTTTYDVAVVGNLLPGEIITLTEDVTFTMAGEYDIRVDVDPTNQVTESIEVNNRADITVTVTNE
jgi:hypothetical protein